MDYNCSWKKGCHDLALLIGLGASPPARCKKINFSDDSGGLSIDKHDLPPGAGPHSKDNGSTGNKQLDTDDDSKTAGTLAT